MLRQSLCNERIHLHAIPRRNTSVDHYLRLQLRSGGGNVIHKRSLPDAQAPLPPLPFRKEPSSQCQPCEEHGVARWSIVRLYEISRASDCSKKLVCVVKNTKDHVLIYFLYDGTYDKFIVCNNISETADDAVHYDTPRQLINAEWPSDLGHSVVDTFRYLSVVHLLLWCLSDEKFFFEQIG